jgi:hypothetical protein
MTKEEIGKQIERDENPALRIGSVVRSALISVNYEHL